MDIGMIANQTGAWRKKQDVGCMDSYFAGFKLESPITLDPFALFDRQTPYSGRMRLHFSKQAAVASGKPLFSTPEMSCSATDSGWLFATVSPAPPAWLRVSGNYRNATLFLPPTPDRFRQQESALHLLRTAIECAFSFADTVSLHASCIALDGKALAFAAPSGAGKSTRAAEWTALLGAELISGDRPAIRLERGQALACGVPWDGKERRFHPAQVPLLGILEVRRAPFRGIRRLSRVQAGRLLMRQCFLPMWDDAAAAESIRTLWAIAARVPFYRLFGEKDAGLAVHTHRALFEAGGNALIKDVEPDMRVKSGFVLRNVVGEHIVMPVGDNINKFEGALVLNEVGAFIWERLQQPLCRGDLLQMILGEFEVTAEEAQKDLDAFLQVLKEHALLLEDEDL